MNKKCSPWSLPFEPLVSDWEGFLGGSGSKSCLRSMYLGAGFERSLVVLLVGSACSLLAFEAVSSQLLLLLPCWVLATVPSLRVQMNSSGNANPNKRSLL